VAVEIWDYRETVGGDLDLTGYKVEAQDGEIGTIDEATFAAGSSYLVVDTGPWILGKKVMLPAGTIERIDLENQRVIVDRTKDEIKEAPEYDPSGYAEQEYQLALAQYYARFYT
jgi:hypothetical protein